MSDRRKLFDKLSVIAEAINRERGPLTFCGLLHRTGAIDRWDFIVSADGLDGFTRGSLNYLVDLLRKTLTRRQFVSLSHMEPRLKTDRLIKMLRSDDGIVPGKLSVPMDERYDRAYVLTAMKKRKPVKIY